MSQKELTPAELAQAASEDAAASGAEPLTEQQRQWVEKLREHVSAGAEAVQPSPVPSLADYLRAVEERRAFDPKAKRGELYDDGDCISMFLRMPATEGAAAAFRAKYPAYFPADFWKWPLPSDEELHAGAVSLPSSTLSGAEMERYGARAWDDELPSDYRVVLSGRPASSFWQAYRDVLKAAWACGFADEYVVRLLNVPTRANDPEDAFKQQAPPLPMTHTLEFSPLFRFQQDTLTLVRSTWRAKMCEYSQCRQPFVADKPSRRFCPERYAADKEMSCYKQHRREVKRDLWGKHGKEWRKGKARRKRAQR